MKLVFFLWTWSAMRCSTFWSQVMSDRHISRNDADFSSHESSCQHIHHDNPSCVHGKWTQVDQSQKLLPFAVIIVISSIVITQCHECRDPCTWYVSEQFGGSACASCPGEHSSSMFQLRNWKEILWKRRLLSGIWWFPGVQNFTELWTFKAVWRSLYGHTLWKGLLSGYVVW